MKFHKFAMILVIVGGIVELFLAGMFVITENQREKYWADVSDNLVKENTAIEIKIDELNQKQDELDQKQKEFEEMEMQLQTEITTEPTESNVDQEQAESETPPVEEIILNVSELEPYSEESFPDDGAIVYTTAEINVRAQPTTSSKIVGKLEKGARVFRYDTKNGWSRILYGDQIAYIYNQYVNAQKIEPFDLYESVDEIVYSGHDVNIRMAPSTYAPSIGKLKQGDSVRRIGIGKNGWSQVIYNNQLFFINSRYLSTDPDFVIPLEWFLEQAEKDKEKNEETAPEESSTLPTDETVSSETASTDPTT